MAALYMLLPIAQATCIGCSDAGGCGTACLTQSLIGRSVRARHRQWHGRAQPSVST